MKRRILFFLVLAFLLCGGCSRDSGKGVSSTTTVEQVLAAQTATEAEEVAQSAEPTVEDTAEAEEDPALQSVLSLTVDIDLTAMSSDMVYATVYQMMANPQEYVGQRVRMAGQYVASYYDVTELTYHYCLIADATACCSQGLEFVVEGAQYPDDYPTLYTEILVVGTFSTYEELGYLYCTLEDATMAIAQ